MFQTLYKGFRKLWMSTRDCFFTPYSKCMLFLNGVHYQKGLKVLGPLKIHVTRRGYVNIGKNLHINSGENHNIIGRQQKNTFWVEGKLTIGDNVGMSCTAIICKHEIHIGNNVVIGGNTVIYDTDFHSLAVDIRNEKTMDSANAKWGKVVIEDNAFIGAHTTILKGVTIGTNAIVGACSVITSNVPANEIWAGNPARFIKSVNT